MKSKSQKEWEKDRTNFAQECLQCGASFEGYTKDGECIIEFDVCRQCIKQAIKLKKLVKELFKRENECSCDACITDLPKISRLLRESGK